MASRFIENPAFIPAVQRATVRAMDDMGQEIVRRARAGIQGASSSAARAVSKDRARQGMDGPMVRIKMGPGLGRIFEFSKQRNRTLRGRGKYRAGTNRGVMQRREFFHRAKDEVIRRGIDLARYL